jgi:hypothetical protein
MRRLVLMAVAALVAAVLVPLAPTTAGAGEAPTTDVYVIHGLNLGPPTEGGGGTSVTVCSGEAELIADFQFGDVVGPVPLDSGVGVPVQVYPGEEDCADPFADPLIDQEVTPEGEAAVLVATAAPGVDQEPGAFELLPFELDLSCYAPGLGRAMAAHAAAAPPVDVTVDGAVVTELAYGDSITAPLPAGDYVVGAEIGGEDLFPPLDVTIDEGVLTAAFVVGNQPVPGAAPSPVVALALTVPLEPCEVQVTTTPAPPTTAAAAPAAAQPLSMG